MAVYSVRYCLTHRLLRKEQQNKQRRRASSIVDTCQALFGPRRHRGYESRWLRCFRQVLRDAGYGAIRDSYLEGVTVNGQSV